MLSKWPWAWQSQWALWREAYRTTATPLGLERLVGLVPATADSKSSWPITMSGNLPVVSALIDCHPSTRLFPVSATYTHGH